MPRKLSLKTAYDVLYKCYGSQNWWPGDTPFEIMVGAVLTQNTAWTNVEKAITNLKQAGMLNPDTIATVTQSRLAGLLRPAGYFNIKAKRLKNYCVWYLAQGEFESLDGRDTGTLRQDLLSVNGIGLETADDILLYAFNRPVFVIDAYTRRMFSRLKIVGGTEHYDTMRLYFEQNLIKESYPGQDGKKINKKRESELVLLFNEFHALIVHHAKHVCRKHPACVNCCYKDRCPSAASFINAH